MIAKLKFVWALAAVGLCAAAALPVSAQNYPNRPIKIIVPFAPGGVDVTARLIADRLSSSLGQPVVVENKPGGAGGSVGAKAVATADPDGYTLLFSTPGPVTISPAVNKNVDYDSVKSFAPVAMVSSSPLLLVANPAFPPSSVKDLVAYAKANPGKVLFPSPGYGTQPHLLGELFKQVAGISLLHVPYRGSAPSITDLIAGQVQIYFDNFANLLNFVQAGKLKAIAVTSAARNEKVPDLPTMAESGFDGFVVLYWNGVLAPAGTPPAIVERLNAAVSAAVRSPDVQASLAKLGSDPSTGPSAEFAAHVAAEAQKWSALAKSAGIRVD